MTLQKKQLEKDSFGVDFVSTHSFHFIYFILSEKQFINNIIFTKYKVYYLFNVEFA